MIRQITNEDFDFIYGLYMHPEVNRFLLYEQMPATAFQGIFQELLSRNVLFIFEKGDKKIGMFKLVPMTYRASHIVYLGGLAIDPVSGGKGYGFAIMKEIQLFAKKNNFLRIELSVACINEKAIRLYEKAGFVTEGILKNYTYLKSERIFLDEVLMAWLL